MEKWDEDLIARLLPHDDELRKYVEAHRRYEEQLEQFKIYYRELVDWNRRVNLTSITGCEEVQVRHFLDSLTVTLAMKSRDGQHRLRRCRCLFLLCLCGCLALRKKLLNIIVCISPFWELIILE